MYMIDYCFICSVNNHLNMFASQKKPTEDKYEAGLQNKIRSLKTRLQVMTNNVVQEKQELKQNVFRLQQVKKREIQDALEFTEDPSELSTNLRTLIQATNIGTNPIGMQRHLLIELLGSLRKEETEIKEDLRISYESWEGVRQVVHNMKLELGELKIKQNTTIILNKKHTLLCYSKNDHLVNQLLYFHFLFYIGLYIQNVCFYLLLFCQHTI